MKKLKHYLTASIGLILFVSVIALSLPQNGHSNIAADKDVRVINTSDEPVPVVAQGTTNVAVQNTPTVNARQNGAWNVGITGTPTVQLDDSATNPVFVRDVDRPTAQPFQYQARVTLPDGQSAGDAQIPVPEGKMLVIEFISVSGSAPPDHQIYLSLLSVVGTPSPDNLYLPHFIEYTKQNYGSFNNYTANQQTRIYADAPSVTFRLQHLPATGAVTFRVTVSGYFVDK
ncbi:MAG: hypothetical protein M3367_11590 [Acidobacteriota bacterium]|nr:hypothetical protein [Acidobacteriota bacterium]